MFRSVLNNILKVAKNPSCASTAIQDLSNISITIVKGQINRNLKNHSTDVGVVSNDRAGQSK